MATTIISFLLLLDIFVLRKYNIVTLILISVPSAILWSARDSSRGSVFLPRSTSVYGMRLLLLMCCVASISIPSIVTTHDDVIKWKHFPRNWPFVREIHRSPVNFPHKGQWRGALMFSLIYAWINDWVNNREAGDLRRQHGHYDVIVMAVTLTIHGLILN